MPVSAKSLHARGLISDRQMKLARLKGTHSQKSKMAPFDAKHRDEGKRVGKGIGEVCYDEIDKPATQKTSSKFKPSRGAQVGKTGSLPKNQINAPGNAKKFPAGGKASGSPKHKPAALKGTKSQPSFAVYDTPSRN